MKCNSIIFSFHLFFYKAPHWLMSFFDRDAGMAVTPDGLRCQSRDPKAWQGVRCTKGVVGKGKYYYEATVSDEGLCRVGWATPQVRKRERKEEMSWRKHSDF